MTPEYTPPDDDGQGDLEGGDPPPVDACNIEVMIKGESEVKSREENETRAKDGLPFDVGDYSNALNSDKP